ncbi:hypothetical protein [Candidatus Soleaferrea massiliensis]|uniref:hypothetical protein n=1 Tax=Candidatus Soleaferrea massiliensis TaxID=1470354 RepID=UPI00058C7AB9|nr:hypothetical protein [Candidatus Soleaferrea massiliensis]
MIFSKKDGMIDTRPTAASWPKRIFELSDVPERFLPALRPWLDRGLEPAQMIFVPRVQHWLTVIPESLLFRFEQEVVFVERGGEDVLVIEQKDVLVVRHYMELLKCQMSILYRQDGEIRRKSLSYSRMSDDLMVEIYNTLLGNPPEYAPNLFLHDNTACERLFTESYMMYNFGKLCYRLSDHVESFFWQRRKKQGLSKFMKSKADPENLVVCMTDGISMVNADFYGFEAVHLPWKSVQDVSFAEAEDKAPAVLSIQTAAKRCYTIPIEPGREDEAQRFQLFIRRYRDESVDLSVS